MHQRLFGSRTGRANEVSVLGKTALIVDDSKTARVVLKRVLETHALVVDTAESAETALEYLSDHRPDVIFMDHMMPGMDGLEAVSAIKNNPDTATIPIMMYTSQKGEVYVGQARALGAVGVLPKEVEPVEVSKMLASLRVIDSQIESNGEAAIAESAPGGDDAVDTGQLDQPEQSIRILMQDLFDQQRAILRRDLQDSYETIAAKVVDEIRMPADDEKEPVEREIDNRVPANYQVAAAVLAIIVLTFGWLYWEREQSWLAVQQQNDDLVRALEQQQSIEAQGAIEVQQRLDGYQQSLGNAYESALRAIEWGINQTGAYGYGRMPLDDARLPVFEALLAQLLELGFTGQVRIETHVGDFCLSQSGAGTYVPAAVGLAVSRCDLLGLAADEALELGRQQSVAFANFVSNTVRQTGGQIRFDIVSLGISEPLVDYPVAEGATTAAQWNAVAEQNNRINVTLYPD
jgi:CheY-like chemotaxis protein